MADDYSTATPDGEEPHADAPATHILVEYLSELKAIRASGAGVPETSYYPALSNLFNAVGNALKPKVRCVISLGNRGAGLPDGGLFTADQFSGELKKGQLPSRGAIEVKGTSQELLTIAAGRQVRDYLGHYGLVVVTNLRSFAVLTADRTGGPEILENFSLAESEQAFWNDAVAHPRATAQAKGSQFVEFIRRVCLHHAPLCNPKDVAWFLASYARDALARVERQKQLPALQAVRSALEEALGMKFMGEKGEHFFRSTLVQTLFYGIFSAWVLWHRDGPAPDAVFDWQTAEWSLHIPFIRTLYEEVAKPSRLRPLELVEPLNWSATVLNRVDRGAFFKDFDDQHAVQYFYEPFLEAYDPELRKELGVWYTPPEIVQYQVARVDRVLREELNLADGLADPNVVVLDPCCGTGAYLVEVLRTIAETLREKSGDALAASDLKQAAMTRVFGFEIMPAPFVVSHLQLGLMLQAKGARLSQTAGERVGVYLTNALTGWEPDKGSKQHVMSWLELAEESDAAEQVKRESKILVVLGNPPYNAFAGVSPQEEQGLVEPYKKELNKPTDTGGWGIKKFNLDDLYVRFFRLAERRIAEMSGMGVISLISNFSYLSDPSFVVMRQRFLGEFDDIWLDCMNGDSRETGKLTPEGKSDPSVFSTTYNREGIRVGTAVCVIVRKPERRKVARVRFRQFWGVDKRAELLESLKTKNFNKAYTLAVPSRENRLSFRPENVAAHYTAWPKVTDLGEQHFNGPVERRNNSLIAIQAGDLSGLKDYLNPVKTDAEVAKERSAFMKSSGEFKAVFTRNRLKGKVVYRKENITRYPFKPMDTRYAYLDAAIQPLFSRPSPELLGHARVKGNRFLITRDTADKTPEGPPFYFSRLVCDYDSISGHARHFPAFLAPDSSSGDKPLIEEQKPHANLSPSARKYLAKLGVKAPDTDAKATELLWLHALAIGYSPAYINDNADGIRRDWPRMPLPANRKMLLASAALGEQIAALLDTVAGVPGVTAGALSPLFKTIGPVAKVDGAPIDPSAGDLDITAGWGHRGKQSVVMPAKGKTQERGYNSRETDAIAAQAATDRTNAIAIRHLLGEKTLDIYLNNTAFWCNIPTNVWEYYIGGYQVIKKWLSYRECDILGRSIQPDEAREVTNMARRIAAIIVLHPKLDENYHAVKDSAFDWHGGL